MEWSLKQRSSDIFAMNVARGFFRSKLPFKAMAIMIMKARDGLFNHNVAADDSPQRNNSFRVGRTSTSCEPASIPEAQPQVLGCIVVPGLPIDNPEKYKQCCNSLSAGSQHRSPYSDSEKLCYRNMANGCAQDTLHWTVCGISDNKCERPSRVQRCRFDQHSDHRQVLVVMCRINGPYVATGDEKLDGD